MTDDAPHQDRGPDAPAPRRAAATIYDVARIAGVSPSAVSRALNKPGRISASTERRIRDVAAEIDYRLNPMARALPTGRTSTIGLVLSDITNPVYFSFVRGAQRAAASAGYTLILAESQESAELEQQTTERLLPSVDGLVLVAARLSDVAIKRLSTTKPIMLVNRTVGDVPSIVPDVAPGIIAALAHLRALGHRSIAFLSGPTTSFMSHLRWDVLLAEAVACGLSIVEIGPGNPTLEGGSEALLRVRASGVTAVVAYNDLMAIGLLQATRAQHIAVPEELSIVGFDDIFGSDFTSPPVTTIRSPLHRIGEVAVGQLVATVEGLEGDETLALATEFVERASTGAPRHSAAID